MTTSLTFATVDPATGNPIAEHAATAPADLEATLDRAVMAQRSWARTPVVDRARALHTLGELLLARRSALAEVITLEMGKPIRESLAEVDKCAATARWLAGHGPAWLAPEPVATQARRSEVRFAPLGVVLAVMPWNYPLWQVMRAAVPAVLAGNSVILKHAPNVTGCALEIPGLFDGCFPPHLLQTIVTDDVTTAEVIADHRIAGVTLTGSVGAGRAVGAAAGRHLTKAVLELGGSDPFVVLSDADIPAAAAAACRARMQNGGQSCIAAKRFIVVRDRADEFLAGLVAAVARLVVGDPRDPATDVGPIAREDLRDQLVGQLEASVAAGAHVAAGGELVDTPGWWFPPTVLTEVTPQMPVWSEETFGPLAAVLVVDNDEQAIAAATHPEYGLGASLWTEDTDRALALADEVGTGMVFVNAIVASDVRLPFGGIGASGVGRELGSFGLREFTNIRTVCVGSPTG